jgi:hypothetical protein
MEVSSTCCIALFYPRDRKIGLRKLFPKLVSPLSVHLSPDTNTLSRTPEFTESFLVDRDFSFVPSEDITPFLSCVILLCTFSHQ